MLRPVPILVLAAASLAAYEPMASAFDTRSPTSHATRAAQSAAPASHHDIDDDDDRDSSAPPSNTSAPRCRHQTAQPFLIRSNYLHHHGEHARAIRYRTEQYGHFEGFGESSWNAHPPRFYAERTTFMGLPVTLNRRVIPALQCAEAEIRRTCSAHPYRPRSLAGIRFHNTYHSGEITNHAYGIAIDVDPDRNTCCHCVGRWAEAPLCRRETHAIWERMAMPECWVTAFERFGFYWLGHDTLQDTMHFEFLGDPDRIVRGH